MANRRWLTFLLIGVVATALVACDQGGEQPQDQGEGASPIGEEAVTGDQDLVAVATEAQVTGEEMGDEPEPMITSGSVPAPPQEDVSEVQRPTPEAGIRRHASPEEAREIVPFTLLEPTVLPENTNLTIVQVIEPAEGETDPTLPAARLMYDIDLRGVLVVFQSPATGEEGTGESLTVAGHPAWLDETTSDRGNALVLVWEQDGVRIELRATSLDRDTLLAAAESMAPMGEAGADEE